jgi:hypothetical protein
MTERLVLALYYQWLEVAVAWSLHARSTDFSPSTIPSSDFGPAITCSKISTAGSRGIVFEEGESKRGTQVTEGKGGKGVSKHASDRPSRPGSRYPFHPPASGATPNPSLKPAGSQRARTGIYGSLFHGRRLLFRMESLGSQRQPGRGTETFHFRICRNELDKCSKH